MNAVEQPQHAPLGAFRHARLGLRAVRLLDAPRAGRVRGGAGGGVDVMVALHPGATARRLVAVQTALAQLAAAAQHAQDAGGRYTNLSLADIADQVRVMQEDLASSIELDADAEATHLADPATAHAVRHERAREAA